MKKKILAIILPVLLLLTGCSEEQDKSSTKVNSSSDESLFVNPIDNIYPTGAITPGTNQSKHMYVDFENMEQAVLCSKPNCTHDNSECVSKVVGECPIIYNGYIYYFISVNGINETKDGREFYIDSKLNRISLETSEIETVAAFTDCAPAMGYAVYNGVLYFCGHDLDPTEDVYGNITSSNIGGTHFLCSIDLDTGEYKNYGSIYDGDKQYEAAKNTSSAHVSGFYDSKIYMEYSFCKESPDSIGQPGVDARDVFTVMNFEFDPETGTINESELPSGSYIHGDTYVYSNYPDNSSTVIYKGEKYTVDSVDSGITGKAFNYKLFLSGKWYDIKNGTEHIWNDEYKHWRVVTMYEDEYILANPGITKFQKLTEEELLALDEEK